MFRGSIQLLLHHHLFIFHSLVFADLEKILIFFSPVFLPAITSIGFARDKSQRCTTSRPRSERQHRQAGLSGTASALPLCPLKINTSSRTRSYRAKRRRNKAYNIREPPAAAWMRCQQPFSSLRSERGRQTLLERE